MACMACSSSVPAFSQELGIAPLGVGNWLWFNPERGTRHDCLAAPIKKSTAKLVSRTSGRFIYYLLL
eukprot:239752-Chlamydomonas_euryale.AAC.5